MIDDLELLRRFAGKRSEEAFTELVRRHIDLVYHAALRQTRGNTTLAEDVAQTVFTDLARKAGSLLQRSGIVGWLYTSTRFAAAKANRAEQRRQAREHEAYVMQNLTHEFTGAADWEKLRPVIDEVLHELAERDREAVLLRFFKGQSFSEVGAQLSMTEDTARVCVARALEKMQVRLARRGVTSTTAALSLALAEQVSTAAPAGLVSVVAGAAIGGAAGGAALAGIFSGLSFGKVAGGVAIVLASLAIGVAIQQRAIFPTARASTSAGQGRDQSRGNFGFAEQISETAAENRHATEKISAEVPAVDASNDAAAMSPRGVVRVMAATDSGYRLSVGDTISVTVSTQSNQTENTAAQTIGHSGDVRLPWIKEEVILGGKTVREAEHYLEDLYRERKLLKAPVVSVKVAAYFPREVSVLGAVRNPGSLPFPPDTTSLDIVQVITKVGGFLPIARQDRVAVTHRAENGEEKTQVLDLSGAFADRRKAGRDRAEVLIYPGDRIWVPESIF